MAGTPALAGRCLPAWPKDALRISFGVRDHARRDRPLAVYTRVRPDPISASFVTATADKTLVNPPHIVRRLGLA